MSENRNSIRYADPDTMISTFYDWPAEQIVLGAVMQERSEYSKMVAELEPDLFHCGEHREILKGIKALYQDGQEISLTTLNGWLTKNNLQAASGGTKYLMVCYGRCPSPLMAKGQIKVLQKCRMSRNLATIGNELIRRTKEGSEPDEIREWAARAVKEQTTGTGIRLISMTEAAMATFEKLDRDQITDGKPDNRIYSGITELDRKVGGLNDSEYVAIGARPGVGKSILAMTYCINAAKAGKRVLLISLEMSEVEITERMIAAGSNIALSRITSGRMETEEWENLASTTAPISEMPLFICREANTMPKIRKAAYQMYENGGLDLIAIDYLQLLHGTNDRWSRTEQIGEISRDIKQLTLELNVPILVLTQLNRASVSQTGKKREPTMSEARESGSIEQDANIFMILHKPEKDEMDDGPEKDAWINADAAGMSIMKVIVEKNRMRRPGTRALLIFDGDRMRFSSIRREES